MLLLGSVVMFLLGTAAAMVERRVEVPAATARRISAGLVAAVIALGCVGTLGYWVVKESPVTAVSNAWDDFKKGGVGPNERDSTSRFSGSVSTYRYDYWKVAWSEFKGAPLLGAGGDNFGRAYARHGKSNQTPRFPHSTFLVALEETGLIGFRCCSERSRPPWWRRCRRLRRPGWPAPRRGSGVVMFTYWLAHSSVDWLWEFPALSGAALLGLGVAMAAARGLATPSRCRPRPRRRCSRGLLARSCAAAIACMPAIGVSWSRLAVRQGAAPRDRDRRDNPDAAIRDLDRAASLNPLSPLPQKAAGHHRDPQRRLRGGQAPPARGLRPRSARLGPVPLPGRDRVGGGPPAQGDPLAAEAFRLAPTDDSAYNFLRRLRDRERITPRQMDRWIQVDVNYRVSPE